jgi:predicted signal transduction protein with EAL and GGDEF domain
MDVGPRGSILLVRTDGKVIERYPHRSADFGRDISYTAVFQRLMAAKSGQFVAVAPVDKVARLYTFRQVGDLPLILSVGVSLDEINAAWRPKAISIGSILAVLCIAMIALCLLLRRELAQRVRAQIALLQAAEQLSEMAATDALTGLPNRRQFDVYLDTQWRSATREELPLFLLLLDVDSRR